MTETGDPYEGADPRLAWLLRVLSDEFGMLGVMETQQAAYYYANTRGRIDHRLGQSDEPPEESTPENHRGSQRITQAVMGPASPPVADIVEPEQEGDSEFLARLGTDARKWAEEFVRLFLGHTIGPRSKVDESLLIAWFANAIEAGRTTGYGDAHRWRDRAVIAERRLKALRSYVAEIPLDGDTDA